MSSPTGIIPCLSSSPVPDKQGKTNKLHPRNIPIVDGEIPMLDVLIPIFMMKSLLLMLNPSVPFFDGQFRRALQGSSKPSSVNSSMKATPRVHSWAAKRDLTSIYIYIVLYHICIAYDYVLYIYIVYIKIQCGCIIYVNLHDVSCIIHV